MSLEASPAAVVAVMALATLATRIAGPVIMAHMPMSPRVERFLVAVSGSILAGITRARHIKNLRADGVKVHESVLGFEDFHEADEVFMTGNMNKITPITEFDGTKYQPGPVTRRLREMYWDWAMSETA